MVNLFHDVVRSWNFGEVVLYLQGCMRGGSHFVLHSSAFEKLGLPFSMLGLLGDA